MDNQDEVEITEPMTELEEVDVVEAEVETDQAESDEVDSDDEAEGESVITFGDDEAPEVEGEAPAPEWVKDVRKKNRELAKELAELKKANAKAEEKPSPLSAKPTLEQADYNEDKFADNLAKWYAEKSKHEEAEKAKAKAEAEQAEAWQSRVQEYNDGKASFKPEQVEDAEAIAREMLDETQQGILIEAFGGGAVPLLVGLSANEKRLKALAGIKNPIRFAVEAAKLESTMKTTTRRPKTSPETRVVGSGSTGVGAKNLEKLRAEAEKTGDYSKVAAFKRELKSKK